MECDRPKGVVAEAEAEAEAGAGVGAIGARTTMRVVGVRGLVGVPW